MIFFGALGWVTSVFADVNSDLRITTLAAVGVMLLGALVVALTARWRKRERSDELTASDQLADYRALYLEGAISKEEFERLRAVLGVEIRRKLEVPAANTTAITPDAPKPESTQPAPPTEGEPPTVQ